MNSLPLDLLKEIFSHLDVTSWVRSKAVSQTWRNTLSEMRPPRNGMPWIWENHFHDPNFCNRIVDISKGAYYPSRFPHDMIAEINEKDCWPNFSFLCIGSFGPWLILHVLEVTWEEKKVFKKETRHFTDLVFLYNPLSSDHRTLPPLVWMAPGTAVNSITSPQAKLSGSPDQCTIALFTHEDVYTCKLDGNGWMKLDKFKYGGGFIVDAAFQTRQDGLVLLIVIDSLGRVNTIDVDDNTVISNIRVFRNTFSGGILNDDLVLTGFHLVVNSCGQLLIIELNEFIGDEGELLEPEPEQPKQQWKIIVHMLEENRLVRKYNLDGGRIFIGDGCNFYCSDAGSLDEFFLKDCVYHVETIGIGDDANSCDRRELWRFPLEQNNLYVPPVVYETDTINAGTWFMPMIN